MAECFMVLSARIDYVIITKKKKKTEFLRSSCTIFSWLGEWLKKKSIWCQKRMRRMARDYTKTTVAKITTCNWQGMCY